MEVQRRRPRPGKLSLVLSGRRVGHVADARTWLTMGSASTMAFLMEAMGLALPFNATAPRSMRSAAGLRTKSGRLIVQMARYGRCGFRDPHAPGV